MATSKTDEMLRLFQNGRTAVPLFETEEEKKIFLQLQRYNLIEVKPEGPLVITKKGNEALATGAEKYLSLERFEKRLVKDSWRRGIERKWLFLTLIPVILLLVFLIIVLEF